jgi:folate-binding protein YgfZ
VAALRKALEEGGAEEAGADAWEVLRVEAGRPAYGPDMDDGTIPVEAGIHDRAIDYQKGCYTGQEVIVRIRDRGHVNRTLRLLHLGDVNPPSPGSDLFDPTSDRPERAVGWITSAVRSPRFEETVALGYVRREVEEPKLAESEPAG